MKSALIRTRCECQATLTAEVDERRVVLKGSARDPRRKRELRAPANTINPASERFDVGWLCPFCMRNTLRSFDSAALAFRELSNSEGSNATPLAS